MWGRISEPSGVERINMLVFVNYKLRIYEMGYVGDSSNVL